ncbi:MAG TPA: VWA domain-containing protein [Vicinamibacterales bacterium]|nr:VWA domain-containing protein [Vicinamibacterales bacterium]
MISRAILIPALAITAGVIAAAAAQDPPPARFRSSVDAVHVDVQVMSGRRPVSGLTAADFELRDSGVVQEIRAVSSGTLPITLLLALDTSSSTAGAMLRHLKTAAREAVGTLRPDDQAMLISFANRVSAQAGPTGDRQALGRAIDALEADGATALYDAVFTAIAVRERVPGRVVLLLCTDGLDTASWLDAGRVLDAALRSDVVVYGVSATPLFVASTDREAPLVDARRSAIRRWFGSEPALFPQGFLEEVAERTGGEVVYVRDGRELARVFTRVVGDFQNRYVLSYSPQNVPDSGWHPIEVRLKNRRGSVQARRGYWR